MSPSGLVHSRPVNGFSSSSPQGGAYAESSPAISRTTTRRPSRSRGALAAQSPYGRLDQKDPVHAGVAGIDGKPRGQSGRRVGGAYPRAIRSDRGLRWYRAREAPRGRATEPSTVAFIPAVGRGVSGTVCRGTGRTRHARWRRGRVRGGRPRRAGGSGPAGDGPAREVGVGGGRGVVRVTRRPAIRSRTPKAKRSACRSTLNAPGPRRKPRRYGMSSGPPQLCDRHAGDEPAPHRPRRTRSRAELRRLAPTHPGRDDAQKAANPAPLLRVNDRRVADRNPRSTSSPCRDRTPDTAGRP